MKKVGRKPGTKIKPDNNYTEIKLVDLKNQGFKQGTAELWANLNGDIIRVRKWENKYYYKKLTPYLGGKYYRVGDINSTSTPVHKVLANAFLGRQPKGTEVNHIDGNSLNNDISNLEWLEIGENRRRAKKPDHYNMNGKYYWKQQLFFKDGKITKMTTDEYYDYLVKTRSRGTANRIFKMAKYRKAI